MHDILDSLWSFLAAGFASEVATLVEHAHRRNESAVNRVDDSGGEIVNIMGVIAELHFAAAEAGAYRPKKLGTRLAEMELKADLDTFHRSAITYAEVLGDEGLDGYLKKLQKVAPNGLQGLPRYGEGFRLRHAFAAHAIATEDPDGLIDLLESNEFISASEYVELVRLLMTLGRVDDATEWADRGLEDEKAGGFDRSELRDLRAELMARTPGGAEAIEGLYWEEFERSGNVRTARDAITHAVDAVELRQRVLDSVGAAVDAFRQLPDRESNFRSRGASDAPIGSIGAQSHIFRARDAQFQGTDSVIAVLIELDEVDRAWAVAMEFGASARSWAGLVELRVDEHPRDALSWALVHAEMEIDHRDRRHYKRAVRVLREAQALATERTSVDDDLNGYLRGAIAELLAAHRNKPSLVDEFQKAGWA